MKRYLIGIALVATLFMLPLGAQAFTFTETVQDYGIDAAGYNYVSTITFQDGQIDWLQTQKWGHTLNANYMPVPSDYTINSATLKISGWHYTGFGNNLVTVGGTLNWTGFSGWQWAAYDEDLIDITNIPSDLWNSSPLEISMTPVFNLGINLTSSVLMIDYDRAGNGNGAPPVSSVPEPATAILIALGVAGTGIVRRIRSKK